MYNLYSSSSESSEEDGDENLQDVKTLDFSSQDIDSIQLENALHKWISLPYGNCKFKTLLLYKNNIKYLTPKISKFASLKYLDVSSNGLEFLPSELCMCPLATLIAKDNILGNKSLPPCFFKMTRLKELNLSGNRFTRLPAEVMTMKNIKFLYLGGNLITEIPEDITRMKNLQVLSMGGNLLTEIPASLGRLQKLTALVLCDNKIEVLPSEIAELKNLKSLLLHKNKLKALPTEIVSLSCLKEVPDTVPSLLELAGRAINLHSVDYSNIELPKSLIRYLESARRCVNPQCKGVYFESRVEHIKFVDFCGKYRIPLMEYLCSANCVDEQDRISINVEKMKRILLG